MRFVVFRENDRWYAQCLEYDMGVDAESLDLLQTYIDILIAAELQESLERTGTPFGDLKPAPAMYRDMWDDSRPRFVPAPDRPLPDIPELLKPIFREHPVDAVMYG